MRRLTKKITSFVLLASFTAGLSSMALATSTGTVNSDCVRLRREASTSSDPLGMLAKGDKVSILDSEDNGWLKISYTDGDGDHTGYVSSEFIKTSDTKKTETQTTAAKSTKDTTKAAADTSAVSLGTGTVTNGGKKYSGIYIRAAKDLTAAKVCKVPVGATLEILAEKDSTGWYQVRYTDTDKTVYSGYMRGEYVKTSVSTTPSTVATVSSAKKAYSIINIRAEKSMDAKVLCQVPIGDTINVVSDADEDGWYQVSYTDSTGNTYNGYMREEYVDTDNSTAVKLTGVVKTKKSFIYIRSKKSTDSEPICKVPAGKTVTLSSSTEADGWYKVSYKDSKGTHKGYMVGKYIKVNSIATGTVKTSTAVLRTSSDVSSKMLAVIPEDSKVSILAVLGDWYLVAYHQQIGYVASSCINSEALSNCNGYGTVTADTLHLRTSRSTDSSIITNLDQGDSFQITSSKKGWYGLTFNGEDGYVKAAYISTTDTVSSGYVQVTSDSLKLRTGAGTNYKQICVIPYGTLLRVKNTIGNWYQVKYKGHTGYVCGDYVSATTEDGYKAYPDFAKVSASSLALRTKTSTDADKVCSLPKGTIVTVSNLKDGWYRVVYGTQKGFIDSSYTKDSNGPATVLKTEKADSDSTPATTTSAASDSSSSSSSTSSSSSSSSSSTSGSSSSSSKSSSSSDSKKSDSSDSDSDSSSTGSGSGSAVLAYARQFVGNPYVWGGNSLTNGTDCSGFVKGVYAHFGKSLPHSSSADRGVGTGVSVSSMRVGDVVCYSGHVGIYAGGGKLLSALGKKYGITYNSVNYKKILAVRRLV